MLPYSFVIFLAVLFLSGGCQGFLMKTDPIIGTTTTRKTTWLRASKAAASSTRSEDKIATDFVERARALGPVGMDLPDEAQRQGLVDRALQEMAPLSEKRPARIPLTGIHQLVYSAAPGGSSGKIGPFTGKVTQEFVDELTFVNAVEFGPLKIALRAERQIKSDSIIKVTFRETTVTLFGQKLTSKKLENSGGVWKYLYCGVVKSPSGRRKLIRVMETPSLFVLEHYLD